MMYLYLYNKCIFVTCEIFPAIHESDLHWTANQALFVMVQALRTLDTDDINAITAATSLSGIVA